METKIMQVFYGADGLPYKDKELQVHYPIVGGKEFTGASNTTEIRFYVDNLGGLSLTWVANAVLPNGITGSKILSSNHDEDGNYVYLQLSNWYTQVKGDLYISLQGYFGGVNYTYDSDTGIYTIYGTPTIQATGLVKINISYATPFVGGGEEENITLQQLLGLIAETKNEGLTVVSNIELADISEYPVGHLFYCMYSKQYYKKTALDNTYEQYTMLPYLDNIAEINFAFGTGNKIYGISGYVCIDATNGLKVNNKLMASQEWVMSYVYSQNADKIRYIDFDEYENFSEMDNDIPFIAYVNGDLSICVLYYDELNDTYTLYVNNNRGMFRVENIDGDDEPSSYTFVLKPIYLTNYILKLPNISGTLTTDQYTKINSENSVIEYNGQIYPRSSETTTNINFIRISISQSSGIITQERQTISVVKSTRFYSYTTATYTSYNKDAIDTKLTSLLKYQGTKTVAQFNGTAESGNVDYSALKVGDFYNVSDSGTISWTYGGVSYTLSVFAGDNICWTGSGWDKLTMDLSVYDDKFIAAGFFEVQNYNESTGEITFVYSSDLYTMSYDTDTGVLTIEAD